MSEAPYGYRYIGKQEGAGQARYEVELEEARVVCQMFTWVGLERCSIGEVCSCLRAQSIPSPKGKPYWDRTTVWGMLKNPDYRDEVGFGKTQAGELRKRLRPQCERPRRMTGLHCWATGFCVSKACSPHSRKGATPRSRPIGGPSYYHGL